MDGMNICKECKAYVDTSIAIVKGPAADIEKINQKIGCQQSDNNRCVLDCSLIPSLKPVVITLGGEKFPMEPENYIQQEGAKCWSGFIPGTRIDTWQLGDFFLDHTYCVFDYGQSRVGFAHAREE